MSGWSWRDAEFFEFANHGPGAVHGEPVDGRPHLDPAGARQHTPRAYLSGWTPWRH
jgi:pectinesterase